MNNPNLPDKKKGVTRVGSGDLLGRRLMWRKSLNHPADDSLGVTLGPVNNMHYNLCEVTNYPGAMPVLIEALKKKGVRFDESRFTDKEITYLNQNVVVLRGAAYEVVHRAFHGNKHGLARKKMRQRYLRLINGAITATLFAIHFVKSRIKSLKMVHKRSLPNVPAEPSRNEDARKTK